jgi:hypothetical protein
LLLPPSRADVELPDRAEDAAFELLRPSELLRTSELLRPDRFRLEICDSLRSDDDAAERDAPAALLPPRAEKKCWFCDTFRVVDAAAARPLAEKLSRLGLTPNLPVLKRAFWKSA